MMEESLQDENVHHDNNPEMILQDIPYQEEGAQPTHQVITDENGDQISVQYAAGVEGQVVEQVMEGSEYAQQGHYQDGQLVLADGQQLVLTDQQGMILTDQHGMVMTDQQGIQQGMIVSDHAGIQHGMVIAEQEGIQEGMAVAEQEGIQQGMVVAQQEGLQEGMVVAEQEGLQEGMVVAEQEGLQEGMVVAEQEGVQQGMEMGEQEGIQQSMAITDEGAAQDAAMVEQADANTYPVQTEGTNGIPEQAEGTNLQDHVEQTNITSEQTLENEQQDGGSEEQDTVKSSDGQKLVTIAVKPKKTLNMQKQSLKQCEITKQRVLTKLNQETDAKANDKPFQNAILKCVDAIDLVYKAEYQLVKYGVIMRDDTSLLKFERSVFDLALDTGGIHYHLCCSDSDGDIVIRYFEQGCLQGFVEAITDEIIENNADVNPVAYSISTTEDVQKRIEMLALKEQERTERWKSDAARANRSLRRLNLGVNQLNQQWESVSVSLGLSEMNIYSAVVVVMKTPDDDPCFLRVVGHEIQHIQNLIFLHKNNPRPPPSAYIAPEKLGSNPDLKKQMEFLCTIPNNHYGTTGNMGSLMKSICIPFPHEKNRPSSIRNKVISAVATNDKKYLFFALKFYHDYRKYIASNALPVRPAKRNKIPTKAETERIISETKAMLLPLSNE